MQGPHAAAGVDDAARPCASAAQALQPAPLSLILPPNVTREPILITFAGFRAGARMTLPLLPGTCAFAAAFGAAAVEKGLTLWEAVLMSGLVYAGASQLVALEVWQDVWTLPTLLTVAAVTATVNARIILMGATLQPWLQPATKRFTAFNLFFLTDANWLIGLRYRNAGGTDIGVLLGAGITIWVFWTLMTIPGHLAGSLVSDPRRWGLDMVMPIFFAAMLVPIWRGAWRALPWIAGGAVALVVHALLGGYVHIIAGALTGALVGAFLPAAPGGAAASPAPSPPSARTDGRE